MEELVRLSKNTEAIYITYLLGAGASALAIPVVHKMKDGFEEYMKILSAADSHKTKYLGNDLVIKNTARQLIDQMDYHASVDTLAKKYWLKRDYEQLSKLKWLLCSYFLFEECRQSVCKRIFDQRYDSLLASILQSRDDELHLPKNINIISWNYDSQLEIAFKKFTDLPLNQVFDHLDIASTIDEDDKAKTSRSRIIKLNGSARFTKGKEGAYQEFQDFCEKSVNPLHAIYYTAGQMRAGSESHQPGISFAWEKELDNEVLLLAQQLIEQSKIVVIIGYSFPIFNRRIDKSIFKKLDAEKITIQAPIDDLEGIKTRFLQTIGGHSKNRIHLESDTDLFYIPFEMDLPH